MSTQHLQNAQISWSNSEIGMNVQEALLVSLNGDETDELRNILLQQLPEFLDLFIRKNREYGENAQTLGPKGQFADIWRKIAKLKTGLWEGKEDQLTSEGVDEILRDLIGHCLLTLSMRSREREERAKVKKKVRLDGEWIDIEEQAEQELNEIVLRLPNYSRDGISKADIENREGLPISKNILMHERMRAKEEDNLEREKSIARAQEALDDLRDGDNGR